MTLIERIALCLVLLSFSLVIAAWQVLQRFIDCLIPAKIPAA